MFVGADIPSALKSVVERRASRSALRVMAFLPLRFTMALTESRNSSAPIHAYWPKPSTLLAPANLM